MLGTGNNGNTTMTSGLPTEPTLPTAEPTLEEALQMELTVLNSLLAKFQSRELISITLRPTPKGKVYSINLPVGTWEMEGGKFHLMSQQDVPTPANTEPTEEE